MNGFAFVTSIQRWRSELLSALVENISSGERLRQAQKEVGVWVHANEIPYPAASSCKITNNECLTFAIPIDNKELIFSIWVMIGEIRIGVKVPSELVYGEEKLQSVSRAYNGQECSRLKRIGTHVMFDWIWADREFASFEFMAGAINSGQHGSIILDRMTQVVTHLYLAITAALLESNARLFSTLKGKLRVISKDVERIEATIKGSYPVFKSYLKTIGGSVLTASGKNEADINGEHFVTFIVPKENKSKIRVGSTHQSEDKRAAFSVEAMKHVG